MSLLPPIIIHCKLNRSPGNSERKYAKVKQENELIYWKYLEFMLPLDDK
jgi:hypothetical protein